MTASASSSRATGSTAWATSARSTRRRRCPAPPTRSTLTINVMEKPTGSLMVGANFSSADKLSLSGSIKQDNVFGSGNYLGVELQHQQVLAHLVLSSVDPYFTRDGISRSLDVYYRTNKPVNSQGESYELVTPGASVRFGVPFSDYDTVFFGIGAERTDALGHRAAGGLLPLPRHLRPLQHLLSADAGLAARRPRQRAGAQRGPLPAGQHRVGCLRRHPLPAQQLQIQQYFLAEQKLTLGLNAEPGYAKGLGGRDYPVFKASTAAAWARCARSTRTRSARST